MQQALTSLQSPPATAATQSMASTAPNSAAAVGASDFRARLSPLDPSSVYGQNVTNQLDPTQQAGLSQSSNEGPGLMGILRKTSGVIFPYAPNITYAQAVNYTDLQLVHSNMDYPAYTRTPTATLTVSGKFTVQNQQEGEYALAVIHFFRTISKMRFGETDALAGLPPPVLLFSAYGPYIYNRLRVLVTSHSWNYDDQIDTVPVTVQPIGSLGKSVVRLPAMFTLQTELRIVQTPQRMRTQFNFDAFASGSLMGGGGGWI